MKKIIALLISCFVIVSCMATSSFTVFAKTNYGDNYNFNIVALGNISSNQCLTDYYFKVNDGNAIVSFDLLHRSKDGYFGFVAGNKDSLGKFENMTDYVLFGSDIISDKTIDVDKDIFEEGFSYRITFNVKDSKWVVDKKGLEESNEQYQNILSLNNTFNNSNTVGLACYTNTSKSALAVIDNLSIYNLKGTIKYCSNNYNDDGTASGIMSSSITNPLTGERVYNGSVSIQKQTLFTVRFIAKNGEIISEQKVSLYGNANNPNAPQINGYEFDKWTASTICICQDCVISPLYKVKEEMDPGEEEPKEEEPEKGDDSGTEQEKTEDDKKSENKLFGCMGEIKSINILSGLLIIALIVLIIKRRLRNENNN